MRRCMVDDIRVVGLHDVHDALTVLDIGDDRDDFGVRCDCLVMFHIDQVNRVFTMSKKQKLFRSEARE